MITPSPDAAPVDPTPSRSAPSPAGPGPTRRELALLLPLLVLLGLPMLALPLGLDQGIYATAAARMLDGHALYAGAWDMKSPGIFFFYVVPIALGGFRVWPIFLATLSMHVAAAVALFRLAAWFADRRVAWAAALLAMTFSVGWGTPISLGQPDDLMLAPFLWALLLLCGAWLRPGPVGWGRPFAAGVLMGWVLLLRSTMLVGVVLLPLLVLFTCLDRRAAQAAWGLAPDDLAPGERNSPTHPPSLARLVRLVAGYVAGGIAIGAVALAYFAATGSLGDLFYSQFVWVRRYAQTLMSWDALSGAQVGELLEKEWWHYFDRWGLFRWALPLGGAGFAAWCAARRRVPWWAVGVWGGAMALCASSSLVQLKFFNYHWWAVAPWWMLALAFAVAAVLEGIGALWRRGAAAGATHGARLGWRALAVGAGAVLAVAAYDPGSLFPFKVRGDGPLATLRGTLNTTHTGLRATKEHVLHTIDLLAGTLPPENYVARFAFEHIYRPQEEMAVADLIRAATPPGETPRLFIWGFRPALYFMLGSGGPSRFAYNLPLRAAWSPPEWLEGLEDEVMREPPDWIAVGRHDDFWWVVGNHSMSHVDQPAWLREELATRFERVAEHKFLELHRRVATRGTEGAATTAEDARTASREGTTYDREVVVPAPAAVGE